MLQNTFLHIEGVGRATERALWEGGVRNWQDVERKTPTGIRPSILARLRLQVPKSTAALTSLDLNFFRRLIDMGEAWRFYKHFADSCVYLDIETTGLSPIFNNITIVGLYDGSQYKTYVHGHNLDELPAALSRYSMVVTYNGSQFDLRFLHSAFENLRLPPIHVDLRWVTRRLGHSGGLKSLEVDLGLRRPASLAKLTGFDATVLWSRYLRGDDRAYQQLIEYNTYDVTNLEAIMKYSYSRLESELLGFPNATDSRNYLSIGMHSLTNAAPPSPPGDAQEAFTSRLVQSAATAGRGTRIVGIDLTGSERRASGWALLDASHASTALIRNDDELVKYTLDAKPDIVSIDSPLSLPGGYKTLAQWRKSKRPIYRACELALKRMGISVFWCLLPSMVSLTLRGMALASRLREEGLNVIESYPGAAQDLLRIPRKGSSLEELKWGLHRGGVEGIYLTEKTSHDEIDAITSALVGLFYVADDHIALGNSRENYLIVPKSPHIDYSKLSIILQEAGLDKIDGLRTAPKQCA